MDKEIASRAFVDFFALRPVFTAWGLKAVWVVFLVSQALPVLSLAYGTYQTTNNQTIGFWLSLSPLLLPVIVYILLVRLFLEVAAVVLLRGPIAADSD